MAWPSARSCLDSPALASYSNRTVLVTGAGGYIGSRLVRALQGVDCRLVLLSRVRRVDPPRGTKAEVLTIAGDLASPRTWEDALRDVEIVFHLAAQTSARVADADPTADVAANVIPVLRLLNAGRGRRPLLKVVFSGTVTEVGLTRQTPMAEGHLDRPITTYDVHKLAVEKLLQVWAQGDLAQTVTLRLTNVYGPGPEPSQPDRGVLNRMIGWAVQGQDLTVYGDGTFVRDYVFIDDVIEAFLVAGQTLERLTGDYFVIGSGVGTRLVDAAKLVADRAARRVRQRSSVVHVPPPASLHPIETRHFVADTSRFSKATGWRATVGLEEGIDRTIDALLEGQHPRTEILG